MSNDTHKRTSADLDKITVGLPNNSRVATSTTVIPNDPAILKQALIPPSDSENIKTLRKSRTSNVQLNVVNRPINDDTPLITGSLATPFIGTQVETTSGNIGAEVEPTLDSVTIFNTDKDLYITNIENTLKQQYITNNEFMEQSGWSGYSGESGWSGFSGYSGISGFSGFTGASGTSGISGFSGVSGGPGASGISGYSGETGSAGVSGYSGESGGAGTPGASGYSGETGAAGPTPWTLPATVYDNGVSYNLGAAVIYEGGYYYRTGNPLNPGYPPTPGAINASWTPVADAGASGYSGELGTSGYSGLDGLSGFSGDSGISGLSGYSGSSGFSGPPGFSSILFEYTSLTSNQTPPPGAGIVQWNNPVQVSATELYVNNVTNDGIDIYLFLELLNQTETITLQDKSDSTNYQTFTISSAPIYGAGWWTIPVTLYTSGGTPFPDAHELILTLVQGISGWSGWSGLSGASGWSGPTGTSGYSGQVGPTGPQGTSGYSGQAGASGVSGASVSLTSTYIGYGSPSNTVTGSAQLTWNNTSRVLTIGSNVAYESTTIKGRSQGGFGLPGTLQIAGADGGISVGGDLVIKGGRSAGSTPGGDLYVQAGDSLNVGDGGSNTGPTLYLRAGTGGGAYPDPGVIVFQTSNLGDVPQTYVERLRMRGTGSLSFGPSGSAFGSSGQVLVSNGDSPPSWQTLPSGTSGYSGATGTGASGYSGFGGDGVSGFSGYSGVGGPGISGYSGATGTGTSGYSGVGGPGVSGYSGVAGTYTKSYSAYFDGTGDYLTGTVASAQFGSGAFTVECWFYQTTTQAAGRIAANWDTSTGQRGSWEITVVGTTVYFEADSDGVNPALFTAGGSFNTNAWNHIAAVRSGNNFAFFVNGTRVGSGTSASSLQLANTFSIGARYLSGSYQETFLGWISNFRIVKGSAVYDPTQTTITVPTAPLTAVANTSLLTLNQDVFVDVNVFGNTAISKLNPFGDTIVGTSGYSGTSGWSGATSSSGWSGYSGTSGTSGYSGAQGDVGGLTYQYSTNTSVSDPGQGLIRFNNGTISSVTQIAIDNQTYQGADIGTYLSSWDDSTSPIKGTLAVRSNTNNDSTYSAFNVSALTQYAGGAYSIVFDGNGDYVTIPLSTQFQIGSNVDFTVETWVYLSVLNTTYAFMVDFSDGTNVLQLRIGDSGFSYNVQAVFGNGASLASVYENASYNRNSLLGTWTHIALCRSGTTTKLFFNGVEIVSKTGVGTITLGTPVNARLSRPNPEPFNGYLSNVRFVVGSALYTANFSPSTIPLTSVSGTRLLTAQSATIVDNSPNAFTLTPVGDTATNTFNPYAYSYVFDGSGDFLTVPDNEAFNFGSGDWTVEFWFRATSVAGGWLVGQWESSAGVDTNSSFTFLFNANKLRTVVAYGGTTSQINLDSISTLSTGTWYHAALVRTSGTLSLYLDGVVQSTSSALGVSIVNNSNLVVNIGQRQGAANYYNGYLSNIRIVKGTAVYTGNFTPPTQQLTPVAGTSLLTANSSRFKDYSANNFTITSGGNVASNTLNPFVSGPGYTVLDVSYIGGAAPSNSEIVALQFVPTGNSGYSGVSGAQGVSGYSGSSGISGWSGAAGISGYSGISGNDGASGWSGYSGELGGSGYSGLTGVSGYSGADGASGYSGLGGPGDSGYSGISGFSGPAGGPQGDSGFSGYSGTTPDLSGYVTLTGTQTLTNKTYTGVRETKVAMAANDVDMSAGNYFTKTITTSTVFTASNVPASGTTGSFIMELTNAGSQTITWFTGTTWASGVAPTLTSAGVDILGFYTFDGGTTWRGLTLALDIK